MMKRLLSLILFLGSIPVLFNAQSLSVGTKQANVGDNICLDLKTEDISNMLTAQFTIDYFAEHLAYTGIQNFNLSQDPPVNSFSNHISGYVTFSWLADDLVNGYDLEPNEVIFEVCFDVLTDNITVPVYLTGSPTSVEITDKDLNVQQISLGLGLVVVGNGMMVNDPIVNIPDAPFKNDILTKGFDLNSDGELQESEAKDIFALQSNGLNIETVEGIQYFSNLVNLKLIDNNLTALDVSNNLNLRSLECQGNSINELELAPELEFLNCSQNNLTDISLGDSPKLKVVSCHSNSLDYIEVSNLWQLEALDCSNNEIDAIVLENNAQLEFLICAENNIDLLDLAANPDLEYLDCSANLLATLEIEDHEQLDHVFCQDNTIDTLILNNAIDLEQLDCSRNGLMELGLSNHPNLNSFKCSSNNLDALNLTNMAVLFTLECQDNLLGDLDLSGNPMLSILDCSDNSLLDLDLSANANISFLNCSSNLLNDLDVSMLNNLLDLNCSMNVLSALEVAELSELAFLNCSHNLIEDLDLSTNFGMQNLNCSSNELEYLIIRNGSVLSTLDFSGNADMKGVCVDFDEQQQVLTLVDSYGYMNCQVVQDCDFVSTTQLSNNSIKIYPTVVFDEVFIEGDASIERIRIIDTKGSVMIDAKQQPNVKSWSIDLSDIIPGIYFVNMQSKEAQHTERIVKN